MQQFFDSFFSAGFSKDKCKEALSASKIRLNAHRSKMLSKIAQHENKICEFLNTASNGKPLTPANETSAITWCESIINDERQIPCYDVASTMCD